MIVVAGAVLCRDWAAGYALVWWDKEWTSRHRAHSPGQDCCDGHSWTKKARIRWYAKESVHEGLCERRWRVWRASSHFIIIIMYYCKTRVSLKVDKE